MKIVVPDLHYTEARAKAIKTSEDSFFKSCPKKADTIVLLGDIYNKYPTNIERVMFANFLDRLKKISDNIILIKGTASHDYSKDIYNLEDITILTGMKAYDEVELGGYVFGHYEVKGVKYSNGFMGKSAREADPNKEYILGHIHLPQEYKNVIYCGSFYKTSFSERDEQKRYIIVEGGLYKSINMDTRPMYQVELTGKEGKVRCKDIELLKTLDKGAEIDLKIVATTDTQTIGDIHRGIAKITGKFNIEYYKEDIEICSAKVDLPKDLDQEQLLKEFCKAKKTEPELVEKEL